MLRTLALVSCLLPALSPAFAQVTARPITGTRRVINNGPGDQTDPHISGALVAYTNESRGRSEIRYHDLVTGQDAAIPNGGAFDFVSDVSDGTVVFTRVSSASAIYTFDATGQESAPVEVAPEEGSSRRSAVIGGRTVAWQDFGYTGNTLQPEVAAYDLDRGTLTRLTNDGLQDRTPAVAPDGRTVVWAKCNEQGQSCDIWQAAWNGSGFNAMALTGAEGEEAQPDTNGEVVVYASTRTVDGVTDRDIYWKPVGGGTERRLALPGMDTNPSVSGSLVAFERRDPAKSDFDIALYDLRTQVLYLLTSSPESENLNDLSVSPDGTVRVVWTVPENGDFNVHSFSFTLEEEPGCQTPKEGRIPADVCAHPRDWPLLASVEVARTTGQPNGVALGFAGEGYGALCLDNGFNGPAATSGWVWLNGHEKVTPAHFKPGESTIAVGVVFDGDNSLTALIAGNPGSAFRIRVYSPPPTCKSGSTAPRPPNPGEEVISGRLVAPMTLQAATVSSMTFIPEGEVRGPVHGGGCSTGGGSLALLGMMAVAVWLGRPRRVAVQVVRKELRRRGVAL
ncbi:TolB family protein [Pyxidicoccus sp. 3LG]